MHTPPGEPTEAAIEAALRLRSEGRWLEMIGLLAGSSGAAPAQAQARAFALLAQANLLGGRTAEAAQATQAALEVNPDDDLVQASLAKLLFRRGDHAGAAAAAARAVALEPSDPDHHLLLVVADQMAGRTDEAFRRLDAVLASHPDFAPAHAQRAVLLNGRKRTDEALAAARTAVRLGFRHPDAWKLLRAVGDLPAAIEALRHRIRLDPGDSAAAVALGDLLRTAGHAEQALAHLASAAQARPADPKAWAAYGTALQELGRDHEARSAYERSSALAPDDLAIALNLAALDHAAGRYEEVLRRLGPFAGAPQGGGAVDVSLGQAAFRLGRHLEAAAAFTRAAAVDPENAEALNALGRTAEEAGVYARLAARGQLSISTLAPWLRLCGSDPSLGDPLSLFDQWSGAVGATPADLSRLAISPLIDRWRGGDVDAVRRLLTHQAAFVPQGDKDRVIAPFFSYLSRLAAFRAERPQLYDGAENLDEVHVVGESHALSPANLRGRWRGRAVRFRSRFIMGIKMFHLACPTPTAYSAHLRSHLASVPEGGELILAMGEIDCRPDEGIWSARRRAGRSAAALARETVEAYLAALDGHLSGRPARSITLQGVPAPAYDLAGRLPAEDRAEDFLAMIRDVNAALAAGAAARGWDFLDTHAATVGPEGHSHRRWHIDGYHLSPAFYIEAADQARRAPVATDGPTGLPTDSISG